jgi:hypothetical protein
MLRVGFPQRCSKEGGVGSIKGMERVRCESNQMQSPFLDFTLVPNREVSRGCQFLQANARIVPLLLGF